LSTVLKFNDDGSNNSPQYRMKVDAIVILLTLAMVPGETGILEMLISP